MGFRAWLAVFALATLALAGCGDGTAASRDVEASQSNERWELRLRIPGEVRAGEMTAVELYLKNVSGEKLRAQTDCITWFDLRVLDKNGTSVFDWRDYAENERGNPECPPRLEELVPGETLYEGVSFLVERPGDYSLQAQPPNEVVGNRGQSIDLSLSVKVRAK